MKGLELAEKFYKEFGESMLNESFSHMLPYIAVGLMGSGSECYGYDDDISQDHDFEPGFCVFIPDENIVDSKSAFELERAYSKLPKEFMGFKRATVSPVGGNRHGVIRIGDFIEAKTGSRNGDLSVGQWFSVPEYSLSEAVNGAVFSDNYGELTAVREKLKYFPEDIRLKKLAGNLLLMAQSGQYNYNRCISRGETAAAQLALFEFVKSAINVFFLINKKYMPYYKWCFRSLRELNEECLLFSDKLEFLISEGNESNLAVKKNEIIDEICIAISEELKNQNLILFPSSNMEEQAYIVNNNIYDNQIRNMHILSAV
jgi:hypothetical protein